MVQCAARLGAATFLVGLMLAGPHVGVAAADDGTESPATSASDGAATKAARSSASRAVHPAGSAGSTGASAASETAGRVSARNPRSSADARSRVASSRPVATQRVKPVPAQDRSPALRAAATAASDSSATAVVGSSGEAGLTSSHPAAAELPSPRTAAGAPSAVAVRSADASAALMTSAAQGLGTGIDGVLTRAANWLAKLPANPITDFLQGTVYLLRRTFFPSSVGVVTKPIVVPVYLTKIGDGVDEKLGIYVTLGSNATPALFELDTGGPGLYGAYAPLNTLNSAWWGDGVVTTPNQVDVLYDSGNYYQGYAATTQVSLYNADGTLLLSTGRVTVGQMDSITNGQKSLWTPDGSNTPPIDGAFYGDFGLAQPYEVNGITNVLAQLVYTNGVLPGYRIHIGEDGTCWLQIGLTSADLSDPTGAYIPQVIDPYAPSWARNPYSRIRYYGEQSFKADIKISTKDPNTGKDVTVLTSADVGMTADTGASTTLHNTNMTPLPLPTQYAAITDNGHLEKDLQFYVSATTTTGAQVKLYDFTTKASKNGESNLEVVSVQNDKPGNTTYYLNTGILLFRENDIVYYLGDASGGGLFGVIPHTA
ncbi:hypothetical protein B1R94_14485 [Mycolicibacterium litorale]|nr:hypothetical protein B1R94_14485 [Mycolicibacterium litorale]